MCVTPVPHWKLSLLYVLCLIYIMHSSISYLYSSNHIPCTQSCPYYFFPPCSRCPNSFCLLDVSAIPISSIHFNKLTIPTMVPSFFPPGWWIANTIHTNKRRVLCYAGKIKKHTRKQREDEPLDARSGDTSYCILGKPATYSSRLGLRGLV